MLIKITAVETKKLKELGIELEQKQITELTELGTLTGGLKLTVNPENERPFTLTDGEMSYTSVTLKSLLSFYETLDFVEVECTSLKYHEEYSSKQEEIVQAKQYELDNLKRTFLLLSNSYDKLEKDFENDEGEHARAYKTLKEDYDKHLNRKTPQPKPLNWVQRLFNWF